MKKHFSLLLVLIMFASCLSPQVFAASDEDIIAQAVSMIFADPDTKDIPKAQELLLPLAEAGNPDAQYYMGYIYDYEIAEDFAYSMEKEAQKWYKLAADQGNPAAMIGYALDGYTTKEEIADYIEMALEAGYVEQIEKSPTPDGCYHLWKLYKNGIFIEKDTEKAIEWLKKSAELNYVPAMNWLGTQYEDGELVEQNYDLCYEWELKGAERGLPACMCYVGSLYMQGKGTKKDVAAADEWCRKAAEAGDSDALRILGGWYYSDQPKKAFECYKEAAEVGNGDAMNRLANMYVDGRGVSTNYSEAMTWYEKSGEAGCSWGYANPGHHNYHALHGVSENREAAKDYFLKAVKVAEEYPRVNNSMAVGFAKSYLIRLQTTWEPDECYALLCP